jgi:dihydroorotate dehydrogenase (fumarate)
MAVDLSTSYLGLKLKNPLVVAACSLTHRLDWLRQIEQNGAAAIVLPSLFEEQIEHDEAEIAKVYEFGTESFAEARTYFPEQEDYRSDREEYLGFITEAKKVLSTPIIASLNGTSKGGWTRYAKMIQDAGADALELNIYFIPANLDMTGVEVESQYLDLVAAVKESVSIPLAVKIGPYFSSIGNMAKQLDKAGADGLVLFNRFLQPEINLETLEISPKLSLSTPFESLLPLRWVAILHSHLKASLAVTSGIHEAKDMLRAILSGADVGMIASVLYQKGFEQIGKILDGMKSWMEENEYTSVEQMKGSMSHEKCPNPTAFERGNYMKALVNFVGKPI